MNFDNKFQCNFDDGHTVHNIILTMLTSPRTCSPALTELLSQQLQSPLYDVADGLTVLEDNNMLWMAGPVIQP